VSIDVSVIIPTFRRPSELIEAVSSVLRQDGATVEVFVIDD
jgi:glycosyltransferase involved in cell wall biosynthesis